MRRSLAVSELLQNFPSPNSPRQTWLSSQSAPTRTQLLEAQEENEAQLLTAECVFNIVQAKLDHGAGRLATLQWLEDDSDGIGA